MSDANKISESKRKFTIQGSDLGYEGGRYTGVLPSLAARKAAKQLFRMIENKKKQPSLNKYKKYKSYKQIKFILREMTQGSDKTTYYYEANIVILDKPIVIVRDGVSITITRSIHVKTCTDHGHSITTVGKTPKTS